MWVGKGIEFYNRTVNSFLQNNNIEMYLTHNEGKPVIVERFIRTFKNNVSKYLASISKNVFIDKLEDIINNYNNKYHRTIKVKPVYVK